MSAHAVQLAHHQVWRLARVNQQLHAQHHAVAVQAGLAQTLFETEQAARRVAATLARDAFSAAVLAHEWLRRIASVRAEHFHDVASKRAWAEATCVLIAAEQRGRLDARTALAMNQYLACIDHWRSLRARVSGDPDTHLAFARAHHESAVRRSRKAMLRMQVLCGVTGVALLLALALHSGVAGHCWLAFFGGLTLCWVQFKELASARAAERSAHDDALRTEADVAAYRAFMADPHRGVFLERVWREHPLLFREPPPERGRRNSHTRTPAVQTYVVERQVVVTRCSYCDQLTAVDAARCQHCGAPSREPFAARWDGRRVQSLT